MTKQFLAWPRLRVPTRMVTKRTSFLVRCALFGLLAAGSPVRAAAPRMLDNPSRGPIFTIGLGIGEGKIACDCSIEQAYLAVHVNLRVMARLSAGLLVGGEVRQGIVSLPGEYHGGVYSVAAQWYPFSSERVHVLGSVGLMHTNYLAEDYDDRSDARILDALVVGAGIGFDLWRRPSSTLHLHVKGDFSLTGRFKRRQEDDSGSGSLVQLGASYSFR
jgi:hypothetical protein